MTTFNGKSAIQSWQAAIASKQKKLRKLKAEISQLHKWADGFSDAQIKERRTGELYQRELREELDAANAKIAEAEDKVLRVVRGEFTQICSYCGWESPANSWEALQAHIKVCLEHPLAKASQRELELLAVIEQMREALLATGIKWPIVLEALTLMPDPSALKEHSTD